MSPNERRRRVEANNQGVSEPNPNLIDVLPPSIEEFHIETSSVTGRNGGMNRESRAINQAIFDLVQQIESLAQRSKSDKIIP